MPLIQGKTIAAELMEKLQNLPKPEKFFGAVLVGDDPASLNFLKQKERVAKNLGIDFRLYTLSAGMTTDELRHEIGRLAASKLCGGLMVQLPFPEGVNRHYVLNAIPKEKDPDLLSEQALGGFYTERHVIVPPSVAVVREILERQNCNLREMRVVLIGKGFLIGKPLGFWLQNRVGELTVLDSQVKNLRAHLHDADVIISGAGQADLFSSADLKEGSLVIDFGFNKKGEIICGDFDSSHAEEKNITYTPTPGGTGPILVAKLFENFYALNAQGGR